MGFLHAGMVSILYICYTNVVFDSKNKGFMYKLSHKILSRQPAELLYSVVNDTNAYHEFVPFCVHSAVLNEVSGQKDCELVFAKGPMSRKLVTRNILSPHHTIEVSLLEGDFSHLYGVWRFTEMQEGTLVSLEFEYTFSHAMIQYTFGHIFKALSHELIQTFCQRADEISLR